MPPMKKKHANQKAAQDHWTDVVADHNSQSSCELRSDALYHTPCKASQTCRNKRAKFAVRIQAQYCVQENDRRTRQPFHERVSRTSGKQCRSPLGSRRVEAPSDAPPRQVSLFRSPNDRRKHILSVLNCQPHIERG